MKMKTLTLLLAMPLALIAGKAPRPNIIVILTDDLGYSDVGFNGATDIRTPEMDKLADAGTIFTSAYVVHPFCGPSRMGLMAGRYPHEFGGPFNLPPFQEGLKEYDALGIPESEIMISTVLQDAGYFTGAVGKWHMGITEPYHPNTRGFDEFFGFLGGGHQYHPAQYRPAYERMVKRGVENINEYFHPMQRNGVEIRETEYITDAFSREAVRFIEKASQKDQPFFLYLAYNAPHSPLQGKAEDLNLYSEIKDNKRKHYAAMVHSVDRGVGMVADALKKSGEYEDTLIIFLSDNGGKLSLGATNVPLTDGKGSTYEGGFRIPMFFHWPDNVPVGRKYKHPVSAIDFYPTFAALAGAKIPEGKELDGKNIWKDFIAGKSPRKGEPIFAMRHRLNYTDVGVRMDNWKLTRVSRKSWQLFDADTDMAEKNDLSAQYPERVRDMVKLVEQWSRSHTEPLWFHAAQARDSWYQYDMPNYDKDFEIK